MHTFCSLAILDLSVGHTMDVLSPFISVLIHSDWLFHGESCPRLDVIIIIIIIIIIISSSISIIIIIKSERHHNVIV